MHERGEHGYCTVEVLVFFKLWQFMLALGWGIFTLSCQNLSSSASTHRQVKKRDDFLISEWLIRLWSHDYNGWEVAEWPFPHHGLTRLCELLWTYPRRSYRRLTRQMRSNSEHTGGRLCIPLTFFFIELRGFFLLLVVEMIYLNVHPFMAVLFSGCTTSEIN